MSTTTLTHRPGVTSGLTRYRVAFRHWRWQRPFWAGLLTMLGGLPIMYFPYAHMQFGDLSIRMATTAGAGSAVIGVLLVTLGLTMWYQPAVRVFAGVAALVLALVSLVVSNFGGFVIGYLLALFGGGMSVAWVPGTTTPDPGGADGNGHPTGAGPVGARTAGASDPGAPSGTAVRGTGSALADFPATRTTEKGPDRVE